MTALYLIRHGETDWNAQGIWQGQADPPLNEAGRSQSRRLAGRLLADGVRLAAIYASDLLRAWETATIIGGLMGLDPEPLPALREIDVGRWSGLTREQVMALDEDLLARLDAGEDVPRGGAERFSQLYDRVVAATEAVAARHAGTPVAVVTHGGPVRALLLHAAREQPGALRHPLHVGNTSLSIIVRDGPRWRISRYNDLAHLRADEQAPDMMGLRPDDAERA